VRLIETELTFSWMRKSFIPCRMTSRTSDANILNVVTVSKGVEVYDSVSAATAGIVASTTGSTGSTGFATRSRERSLRSNLSLTRSFDDLELAVRCRKTIVGEKVESRNGGSFVLCYPPLYIQADPNRDCI
jgi:hypothetical protein